MPRLNEDPQDHDETAVGADSEFAIAGLGVPLETAEDIDTRIDALELLTSAYSRLSADTAEVNNSEVLVDSGLTVPVAAGGTYRVEANLIATTGATPDLKLKFVTPGGATPVASLFDYWNGDFVGVDADITEAGALNGTQSLFFSGLVTFVNGGTFKIQFAQATADVSNTHIDSGSFLLVQRVA